MRHKQSEYMHWAKTRSCARFNLATSGVGPLPFDFSRLGDEVLIQRPAYGPLLDAALYLRAQVKRFDRREEEGHRIDPAAVRRALTPRTRLIVLTNLHNPSSVLTSAEVLREIGGMAGEAGALVLVDEVYLDAVYEDTPPSACRLGAEFAVTSSLTKVYGVSGLRCGWIVAAFEHLDRLRERARQVVEADRALLSDFLDRQTAVSAVRTRWGTTAFLRLRNGNADDFLERLRAGYETSVVPGRFFENPGHFRVGMGVNTEMFAQGLLRLEQALHALDRL
jgi:aspartate/methionine/tyrosine aminotransferase